MYNFIIMLSTNLPINRIPEFPNKIKFSPNYRLVQSDHPAVKVLSV